MSAIPGSAGSSGRTKVSMVLVDGLEPPRPDPAACCDQSSYGDQFTTEDLPCERGEGTGCETSSPQSHLREEARVTAVHATPRRHHHLYSWSRRFLTAPARPQQHGCWPAWLLASMAAGQHEHVGTLGAASSFWHACKAFRACALGRRHQWRGKCSGRRSCTGTRMETVPRSPVRSLGVEPPLERHGTPMVIALSPMTLGQQLCLPHKWMRPYSGESTPSRPIWEVKHRQAQLVLR